MFAKDGIEGVGCWALYDFCFRGHRWFLSHRRLVALVVRKKGVGVVEWRRRVGFRWCHSFAGVEEGSDGFLFAGSVC